MYSLSSHRLFAYFCWIFTFKGCTPSVALNNANVAYFFDPASKVIAVKLRDTCYATTIPDYVPGSLLNQQNLDHFETRMLETIAMDQGQKTALTIRELIGISGKIASDCLTATQLYRIHVNSTTSLLNVAKAVYLFDPQSNAIAVNLGNACYIAKISYFVSRTLKNQQKIEEFETHMLELITLNKGHHTPLSIRDVLALSGKIASGCLAAANIYEISDPTHVLGFPLSQSPRDCNDLYKDGVLKSGVYQIYPSGHSAGVDVYCDMTDGGGWLMFQRRLDGMVDFNEDWNSYKTGFGHLEREFWLGNSLLHSITKQTTYMLSVQMENQSGQLKVAMYNSFSIGDESTNFELSVAGYHGNARADAGFGESDELQYHNHMPFSTSDEDHDHDISSNCAMTYGGGWWFNRCIKSDLNGPFLATPTGIFWYSFSSSLNRAEMKIRPLPRK